MRLKPVFALTEGQPLTYRWTQVSGPTVTLSSATLSAPTFVAPASASSPQTLGFQLIDNVNPSQLTQNIVMANNVFADVSAANWGGTGRLLLINGGDQIKLDHNTVFQDGSAFVYAYGSQTTNFVFTSTIVPQGAYGIIGDAAAAGTGAIDRYFPGSVVTGNVVTKVPQ